MSLVDMVVSDLELIIDRYKGRIYTEEDLKIALDGTYDIDTRSGIHTSILNKIYSSEYDEALFEISTKDNINKSFLLSALYYVKGPTKRKDLFNKNTMTSIYYSYLLCKRSEVERSKIEGIKYIVLNLKTMFELFSKSPSIFSIYDLKPFVHIMRNIRKNIDLSGFPSGDIAVIKYFLNELNKAKALK